MSDYLLINLLVVSVPLLLSFENKLKFYKKFPFLIISFVIVGGIYLLWDIAATSRGDWSFNSAYINGFKLFGLPFEEILFFITIPYASIFLYETAVYYLSDKIIKIHRIVIYLIAFIFITIALIFPEKEYTFLAFFISGLFLLSAQIFSLHLINSKIYWFFITTSFIPFFAVNYLLTSFPIVIYNSNAILGIKVLTIPIEDFFYSFTMISFYLLIYLTSEKIWQKRKISA